MRLPADSTDPRTRREVDEYLACYGGLDKTLGPSGNQSLLPFGVGGYCTFKADGSIATAQIVGDLPPGVFLGRVINHVAATDALATITITLPAHGGEGAVTLVNGQEADVVGPLAVANPVYTPLPFARPVQVTIVNPTAADELMVSIEVHPVVRGWR